MLQQWIINIVVGFLLRQWVKFGNSIDFAKVEADMVKRLTDILPSWLDAEGIAVVKALVAGGAAIAHNTAAIDNMLRLAAAEKWAEALTALKNLLIGAWVPTDEAGLKAKALLA